MSTGFSVVPQSQAQSSICSPPGILDSHLECSSRELSQKPWTKLDGPAVCSRDSLCSPFCNTRLLEITLPARVSCSRAYTRAGTPLCAPGCISAVTCASKCLGAVPILKRTENWNQPRRPSAGEWINLDIFMGWNAMQQKRGPTAGVPNSMDAPQKPDEWKKTEVGEFIL